MKSLKHPVPAILAVASGGAWMVVGLMQITYRDEVQTGSVAHTTEAHIALAGLSFALVLLAPVMLELGRCARRDTGAKVAAAGMVGLAILATISNVRGEDPAFFPPVAIVTNLMWLGGSIALAVSLKRAGRISPRLVIALPLTWIAALPLSVVGGPVLTGAYWITVGYLMHHGALERARRVPATA